MFPWAGKMPKTIFFAIFLGGPMAAIQPVLGNGCNIFPAIRIWRRPLIWSTHICPSGKSPLFFLSEEPEPWPSTQWQTKRKIAIGPPSKISKNCRFFCIFPVHGKIGLKWPQMGPGGFFQLIQTLPTFWATWIFIFRICIF